MTGALSTDLILEAKKSQYMAINHKLISLLPKAINNVDVSAKKSSSISIVNANIAQK